MFISLTQPWVSVEMRQVNKKQVSKTIGYIYKIDPQNFFIVIEYLGKKCPRTFREKLSSNVLWEMGRKTFRGEVPQAFLEKDRQSATATFYFGQIRLETDKYLYLRVYLMFSKKFKRGQGRKVISQILPNFVVFEKNERNLKLSLTRNRFKA